MGVPSSCMASPIRAGRADGRSESGQRGNIREKLTEIGSLPMERACMRCLAFFSVDAPDKCRRCGGAIVAAAEGCDS